MSLRNSTWHQGSTRHSSVTVTKIKIETYDEQVSHVAKSCKPHQNPVLNILQVTQNETKRSDF